MKKKQIIQIATTSVVVASIGVLGIVSLQGDIKVLKKELQIMENSKTSVEKELSQLQKDYNKLQSDYKETYQAYTEARNIILKDLVYDPNDITKPSGADIVHLTKALKGTQLEGLAPTFFKAEEEYGINAIMLASLVATESAWGESDRAVNDNNMTGYAVYNDYSNGAIFKSKDECILRTARLLKEDYIPKDSKYNTGANIGNINKLYSADKNWANTITQIAGTLASRGEF